MIHFGTGGWRAIIGDDFIKSNVVQLAQAISNEMKGDIKGIVIGYDRRFLSDMAAKWAAEVLAANNIKVYFIDRIAPTPLVMFTVKMKGHPLRHGSNSQPQSCGIQRHQGLYPGRTGRPMWRLPGFLKRTLRPEWK